jgi:hypothetical protein
MKMRVLKSLGFAATILCFFALALIQRCVLLNPSSANATGPDSLLASPAAVTIGSNTYTLSANLWRDLTLDSDLSATIKVEETGRRQIPTSTDAATMWVIYNGEIWEKDISSIARQNGAGVFEKTVAGGPKWGPDVFVDVVVELADGAGGYYKLKAATKPSIGGL